MENVNYWQILRGLAYANPKLNQSIKLDYYVQELLNSHGTIDHFEVERYCTKNLKMLRNKFAQLIDEDNKRGVTPPLMLDSAYNCQWYPQNKAQGIVWKYRKALLNKFATIDDDSFEALCCYALECMGGKAFKTKSKNDGGVDGYGLLSNPISNHIFGQSKFMKIVGQFKNYDHPEVITNFESFIQTLNNVRHMSSRVTEAMPSFFSAAKGPIIGWYVCKSGFQKQVYDQAKWHGIILTDLIDIIEVLCNIEIISFGNQETKLLLKVYSSIKTYNEGCRARLRK
jgi:hypothetical protein